MKKPKAEYSIQTVVNAVRVLEAFRDDDELGVTDLSRRLALHKNNVFRLLATLEQHGYIEQSCDSERYRLGVRSFELGRSFARSRDLLRCARPVLTEITSGVRECAHLAVLQGFEVVHLDGEQGDRMVAGVLRVGRRLPAHCTALGKVLLGCGPVEVRQAHDQQLQEWGGLGARTPETITDAQKLLEHLNSVSVRGFALDLGECEEGLCCAAAPVCDADGRVIAALSVSGPSYRLSESRLLDEVAPLVVASGEALSRAMGCCA